MRFATALTRVTVGSLFIGHGLQKLTGSFGGHGLDGTGQFFESLGLRPGRRHATAAGVSEAAGGALLALGLFTPVAAAAITGVMTTAIRKVHASNGPWVSDGGFEYNAVLIALVTALVETGPGPLSLDHLLGTERHGTGWALASLAAGVGGSTLVLASAEAPAGAQGSPDGPVSFEAAGSSNGSPSIETPTQASS